ncbi:MAG: hypothetical protein C5B51_27730 [Terriglobia bacterium]|nr:MAG: hypothetical protein C5B51_27730 [Terriglobia bacterium]
MSCSGSSVAAFQTPAPEGPETAAPRLVFDRGFAVSAIIYRFQSTFPVAASSADSLPRNVQQTYDGDTARASSREETPTYRRP